MGKRIRAAVLGTGMAVTLVSCGGSSSSSEVIKETKSNLELRRDNMVAAEENIGKTCVNAMLPYVNGELSDLNDDSLVLDLMLDPERPCGDSPASIRHDRLVLETHQAAVDFAQDAYDRAK